MKDMVLSAREVVDDNEENTADGEGTGVDGEGTEDGGAEGDNTEEDEKPEEQPEEEEKSEPISNAELKESMDAMIVKLEKYLAQAEVEGAFAAATFGSLAVAVAATLAM